ncbi:MAG: hypothetical protein Q4D04_07315, partial [Clostridia bacterium]|nr:hypothetical protein [Clostridia bacterium]
MAKIKVQDATKELAVNSEKLLNSVTGSRKRAVETLRALKRLSDDINRQQREQLEQQRREAAAKELEDAFISAYSTDDVPQPVLDAVAADASPVADAPAREERETPAQKDEDAAFEATPQPEPVEVSAHAGKDEKEQPAAKVKPAAKEKQADDKPAPQPAAQEVRVEQAQPAAKPEVSQEKPAAKRQPKPADNSRPPEQPQSRPQGDYARPAGPYGRPVQPGQYGRPAGQAALSGGPFSPRC